MIFLFRWIAICQSKFNRKIVVICADCGDKIGSDAGPEDGWQLENGRTVCHACCVKDTKKVFDEVG